MSEEFIEVRHYALWTAIDELAVQVNLSPSALAIHAGLPSKVEGLNFCEHQRALLLNETPVYLIRSEVG